MGIRRTITLDPDVNKWIQYFRGNQLKTTGKIDAYGNIVMMLCKEAIKKRESNA